MKKLVLSFDVIRDAAKVAPDVPGRDEVIAALWAAVSNEAVSRRAFARAGRTLARHAEELGDADGRCDSGWVSSAVEDVCRNEASVREASSLVQTLFPIAVALGIFEAADHVVVDVGTV